jgi:hypothetical protein
VTDRIPRPPRRPRLAPSGPVLARGEPKLATILRGAFEAAASMPADALTHGFHTYPGRMHRAIAATLIAELAPSPGRVLDPFCGSGTVLVEAMLRGDASIGVDMNPVALRIAEQKIALRDEDERARFEETAAQIADASLELVRERAESRAPIPKFEARWYRGHTLRELAGIWSLVGQVADERDRRALEMVFSAIVVKFSRQRADTSEEVVEKNLRKGLPTEFFLKKAEELSRRWADLYEAAPRGAKTPRLVLADAREVKDLFKRRALADLVLTSPPYGGTYDYVDHQARRYAWLGLDRRPFERREIGARRNLDADEGPERWDREMLGVMRGLQASIARGGLVVFLAGDAQIGRERVAADEQLDRLAEEVGLSFVAAASVARADFTGGPKRREHLVAFEKRAERSPRGRG